MASRRLIVEIIGDASSLQRTYKQAGTATATFGAAVTKSTKATEHLRRGAEASTLSLLGLRGGTLAASSGFLIGASAVTALTKSVREASSEQEAAARVAKILGDELGRGSERWAATLANSFGLSTTTALKFQGALLEIFHSAHITGKAAQELSEQLVERAADVAAFNNVAKEDVLRSFQLGISGAVRGLRPLGILISAAQVKLEALRETGKKSAADLTRFDLVQARINIILRDSANQAGAAADRSGDLAEQTRILESNLANLSASLGSLLIPALVKLSQDVNAVLDPFEKLIAVAKKHSSTTDEHGKHATALGQLLHLLGSNAFELNKEMLDLTAAHFRAAIGADKQADALSHLVGPIGEVGAAFEGLQGPIKVFGAAADAAAAQLEGLKQHMLDLVFKGASPAARIADLQKQIEAAQTIIAHPGRGGAAAQARARADRNAAQAEIKSIHDQQIADAKARATAVKDAADKRAQIARDAAQKAQAALDAADQSFLAALGLRQGRQEFAVLAAQGTKGLQDDVRAQEGLQKFLVASIAKAKTTIHDVLLRAQTIQSLTAALQTSRQSEKGLRDEQAQTRAAARNARQFVELGLTATGEARVAGVKQIQARLGRVSEAVKGTFLDTSKTRAVLAGVRKVLLEGSDKVGRDVREKIQSILGDINDKLKNHVTTQTRFKRANQKALLAGLGLDAETIRIIRARLSQVGLGGTVPGSGVGAFGVNVGAGGAASFSSAAHQRPLVVHTHVDLNGKEIGKSTTHFQQTFKRRNPPSRRGRFAGGV